MGYSIDPIKYIDKFLVLHEKKGIKIDLKNPKTIQDKLSWLNFYDIDPLKTKCADKILLHDYCKEVLGEDLCIPIIKVYNKFDDINWNELPNNFVIKCNHGSAMNIIVKDKFKIDKKIIKEKLDRWINTDFALISVEPHYYDIPHKIFIEEYMNDGYETLHDYKFWCFNGEPKMYTINDGNGHGDIMYYTMDNKELNLYGIKQHSDYIKPKNFDLMIEYSKKLAKPFKFVRVDMYEINNKVYLGELTFTPGAMYFKYKNSADHLKIGEMLQL